MSSSILGIGAVVTIWLLTVAWMVIISLRVVSLNHKINELLKGYAEKSKDSPNTTKVK